MITSFLLSYIAGTFFTPFFHIPYEAGLVLVICALAIFVYTQFFFKGGVVRPRDVLIAGLALSSFALGSIHFNYVSRPLDAPYIASYVNQKVVLCGIVTDEPDKKDAEIKVVLAVVSCDSGQGSDQVKILLHEQLFSSVLYGDFIKVQGKLTTPTIVASSTFDYVGYLAKDAIFYEMRFASTTVLAHDRGNPVLGFLYGVKQSAVAVMGNILSEPHASLLAGLLLGARDSLGQEWLDVFRRVGIIHIIVLSGYNITVVARFVLAMLVSFSRPIRFGAGSLVIILFSLLAGGGATIWRAAAMAMIALFARESYRNFNAGRALLVAGFLMTIFNPKLPFFDASFQLSFLATAGLIYITPLVERWRWIEKVTERFGLREIVISTASTQIAVLPLILHMSGTLSIIGPFMNILILPLVPATMFFGFVATLLGFVSWILALPFTFISYALLSYILNLARFGANLPFSSVQVPLSGVVISILYIILISSIFYWHKKNRELLELATSVKQKDSPPKRKQESRQIEIDGVKLSAEDFELM